jgi:hypothetical protein
MFTIMVVTFLSSDKLAAAKNKSRDFYRGFGGISELSFIALVTGSDSAPPPRL